MYQDPLTLCSFYFLKAFSPSDYPLWEKLSRKSPYVILNGVKQIVNLTEERRFILSLLPASCQRYYL
ncbi:hypothetical protein WH8501_04985 [Crocosphaera watsonii WH 8501]|uniref:hypothetical protein n=1 Tax=Crocosphaera watsonii TaxID=263511 RepID=UPI0012F4CCA5